jgi:hypothetical protein
MISRRSFAALTVGALFACAALGQTTPCGEPDCSGSSASSSWSFFLTADGYVVPHSEFFVSPTVAADRQWLHLEARYNYENQRTGSLWLGYNFSVGHTLVFEATPMIGGVFGNTTGVGAWF